MAESWAPPSPEVGGCHFAQPLLGACPRARPGAANPVVVSNGPSAIARLRHGQTFALSERPAAVRARMRCALRSPSLRSPRGAQAKSTQANPRPRRFCTSTRRGLPPRHPSRISEPSPKKGDGFQMGEESGGDGGIRTLDTLVGYAHLANECLQPLGHVSGERLYARLQRPLTSLADNFLRATCVFARAHLPITPVRRARSGGARPPQRSLAPAPLAPRRRCH